MAKNIWRINESELHELLAEGAISYYTSGCFEEFFEAYVQYEGRPQNEDDLLATPEELNEWIKTWEDVMKEVSVDIENLIKFKVRVVLERREREDGETTK